VRADGGANGANGGANGNAVERFDSTSIVNAITGLGGTEDKGAVARPNTMRIPLSDAELAALYLHNGIARRIVDVVPAEATRKGWTVTAAPEAAGGKRPTVDAAADEDRRLEVAPTMAEAWSLARLWGHSIVLMVTDDEIPAQFRDDPAAWLVQPLDMRRVRRVLALQVFDALESWPVEYDADVRSRTFRDPLIWGLAPSIPGVTSSTAGRTPTAVHASRVLYFRGRLRPPSLRHSAGHSISGGRSLDDSELQAVYDEVRNLAQTMAGGATLAQELRESVLKVSGLRGLATADQAREVAARMRLMARAKSMLGMIILGEADEYANNSNPPTGFRELSTEAQAMLSAVTGIPLTILFGHAPAGLSTDDKSGRQSWDRVIRAQQENKLAPHLVTLYNVIFGARQGPTKGTAPVDVRPKFRALLEESDGEIAGTRKAVADADAIYLDRGVISAEQVAGRFGPNGFQLDLPPSIEPDEIDEPTAAEEAAGRAEVAGLIEGATVETAAGELGADKFADVALNGAQIAQAVDIAARAKIGEIDRTQAVAMLVHLFNLPEGAARQIISEGTITPALTPAAVGRGDADPEGAEADILVQREQLRTGEQGDAAMWLGLPLASTLARARIAALREAASAALGRELIDVPDPHVTALFVGPVEADDDGAVLAGMLADVREVVDLTEGPISLWPGRVSSFPVGPDGRTPILVPVERSDIEMLHGRLLRTLAPHVTAPQFREFRPHVTLGYVQGELSGADRAALLEIPDELLHPSGGALAAVGEVNVNVGDRRVATIPLGRRDDSHVGIVGFTGPGGIDGHTHLIPAGSALTGPGGLDGHTHTVEVGAELTGPGGADDHTHPIIEAAEAEGSPASRSP
jgi:phage-related protein (TIGR01555 family)